MLTPQHLIPGGAHPGATQYRTRHAQPRPGKPVSAAVPSSHAQLSSHPSSTMAGDLIGTMTMLASHTIAPSTTKAYARTWALFDVFAAQVGVGPGESKLPIAPQIIALFVAYLFKNS